MAGNPAMKRGAPSVNPLGWTQQRQFQQAVRVACLEEYKNTGFRKLRVIATQLVNKACEGDLTAIAMVGDRLDGKPISEHVSTNRGLVDMSDQELLAIVREAQEARDDGMIIENNVDPLP
jgi:hypothetical protein